MQQHNPDPDPDDPINPDESRPSPDHLIGRVGVQEPCIDARRRLDPPGAVHMLVSLLSQLANVQRQNTA